MAEDFDPILFSLLIQEQQEERLKAVAKQQMHDRRQQPYSIYLGTNSEGQALVRPLGSTGVTASKALSNTQPSMGQIGRGFTGGFDTGIVRSPEVEVYGKLTGEVAILAIVRVADNTYQVWLGGNQPPRLVMGGLQNSPSAYLDLIGPGKNDWVVGVSWRQGATLETTAIAMRYGVQDPHTDWQILDNPGCQYLRYYGMGFWCSNAFNYAAFNYAASTSTPFPDPIDPPPGLGAYTKTRGHGQTGGNSTISVEYWENASINGALSVQVQGGTEQSGFIAYSAPLVYTGINRNAERGVVVAEWEGSASGPGYLGPENTPCSGTEAVITGTATAPRRNQTSTTTTELQLSTQSYSFKAENGVFSASVGTHTYSYQRSSTLTTHTNGDYWKTLGYLASCKNYVTESGQPTKIWSIEHTNSEAWGTLPATTTQTASDRTSTLANNYEVAPGVVKSNGYEFLQQPNQNIATATTHYWSPNAVAFGGNAKSYSLFTQSGEAYINSQTSGRPSFYGNSTSQGTAYLDYKGQTLTLVNPLETYRKTWIDKPDSPYPTGYEPEFLPYERLPNGNYNYDKNDVFKNNVKFNISKFTGALINGKVEFTKTTKTAQKKALNLKKVQAIAKAGTYATLANIKYWAKS
jgi:hypothetical protein